MKLLKCLICRGEVDIIGNEHLASKKIRCQDCGFTNQEEKHQPEVIVMRKRPLNQ